MIEKTTSHIDETTQRIRQEGIIAILRGDFGVDRIVRIAETLVSSGVSVLEITLNSSSAVEAIRALRREFQTRELLVGAGTVRTVHDQDLALEAGAVFTVAPNLDPECGERAVRRGVLHVPGVLTATEVETAVRAGCRWVKLFPADVLGAGYLKALRAPLDDVEFVPTGGIDPRNLAGFVRAGAAAVGVGSALISGPDQKVAEVRSRARAFREAWDREDGS